MTKGQVLDLQAVVLCGSGHKLLPLVDEEKLPKCMLPIANRPMLYYPLTWLQQAGITGTLLHNQQHHMIFIIVDILVVAHTTGGQKIQNYLTRIFDGGKVELVLLEDYGGTMDALLAIKSHIKNDFLVVGCDLITDYPMARLLKRWRISDAKMMTVLTLPIPLNFGQQPKDSAEPKHRLSNEGGIVVGLDKTKTRTLSWIHKDDLEEGSMNIPMALLARFPQLRLFTDLSDIHLYLFRRTILDNEGFFGDSFSIREDFVPRLIRRQLGSDDHYRCETIIVDSGYCVRANTLSSLAECGKQLTRLAATNGARLVSQAAEIGNKAQIGNDSMIGDHSQIGDKSSVKRSIVGNYVQIGSSVKISNSVILDHVVVDDNVKLEGCIIGMKAIIREKSYLKDCDVGSEYLVEKDTTCKGEILGGNREIYLDDEQ